MPTKVDKWKCSVEGCMGVYETEALARECEGLQTKPYLFDVSQRVRHRLYSEPTEPKRGKRKPIPIIGQVVGRARKPLLVRYFSGIVGKYIEAPTHINIIKVLLDEPLPFGRETVVWFREEDFEPVTDRSTDPYQKN